MGTVAYLDPGAGNLIASVAAGGIAGVAVVAKSKWRSAKSRLTGRRAAEIGPDDDPEIQPSEAG